MDPLGIEKSDEAERDRQAGDGTPEPVEFQPQQRRRPGMPIEDPDVEAFLQIAARIVLRLKGLSGSNFKVAQDEDMEVNRDSA
jgi:hypothetical protein